MAEFGKFFRDRQRQASNIVPGSVISNRPDGDVNVRIRHTGKAVVASKGNTAGSYTPGQIVQLSRTDATGVTSNTGWVIIGPPPSSMKGSSKSVPLEETTTKRGSVVTRIVPNPVLIDAGAVVTVNLYGVFAEGVDVTYGSDDLSDDVAPVVTPTQITLQVRAGGGANEEDVDLLIDGVVIARELFHIVPLSVPEHSLWALCYDAGYATECLLRIDTADMSVFHRYEIPLEFGSVPGLQYVGIKATAVYAKVGDNFEKVDRASGADLGLFPCTPSGNDEISLADAGALFFYVDGSNAFPDVFLREFDTATDTESGWLIAAGAAGSTGPAVIDSSGDFVWASTLDKLYKWDIGSATLLDTINQGAGNPFYHLATGAASIYAGRADALEKYDSATAAVIAGPVAPPGGAQVKCLKLIAGFLWVGTSDHDFIKYDPDTLAVLDSVAIGFNPLDFTFLSGTFYIADGSGGVVRVDEATMTVIDRTVFVADEVGSVAIL